MTDEDLILRSLYNTEDQLEAHKSLLEFVAMMHDLISQGKMTCESVNNWREFIELQYGKKRVRA